MGQPRSGPTMCPGVIELSQYVAAWEAGYVVKLCALEKRKWVSVGAQRPLLHGSVVIRAAQDVHSPARRD